ncbi:HD domain-containing protein [Sorangium sp. So ce296]|uniref:HD domain-containing protein n=1 Tax=Sorangium sp. So ce296 TaxID=3133296 RepID=UPI003F5F3D2C
MPERPAYAYTLPTSAQADQETREAAARRLVEERHAGQRYGQHPYCVHLAQVRAVLAAFGHGGALGVAAWLHDALEDTATTREEIAARFGEDVAALMWAVTGTGRNRKERNRAVYEKIRQHPEAAILKLADRIANAEASREHPDKRAMYRSEQEGFEQALAGLGTRGCGRGCGRRSATDLAFRQEY